MVVTDLSLSFHPVPKIKVEKKTKINRMKQKSRKLAKAEKNRYSILTDNFEHCYLCEKHLNKYTLNKHEVFFGNGNRIQSMTYGLVVPLCNQCHTEGEMAVHNNYFTDLKLKQIAQNKFEETHSRLDFKRIFGKNFL